MFKKFLFSILILISFAAQAQVKTKLYVGGPLATNVYRGPLGSDSALYIMAGCDSPQVNLAAFYNVYRGALIYKDTCNDQVWTSNPDTTWSKLFGQDTNFYISGDTFITNKIRIKNLLNIPQTDTTNAIKGCANIIYDTINEHFYGDVCINGTHYAWQCFDCTSGIGTVTSVATNDATGIKGGTITTAGTLYIDTAIISTKANVDSKTITLNQGSNVTITGNATQNLGQNPSWTIAATTSGGSTNSNIGSGYRWAVPNTNNIKTVFGAYAITIDSTTNANALTFAVDTSSGIHTEAYFNTKYVRISDTAAMLSPYLRTAGDLNPLFTTTESSNNIAFSQQNTTQYTVLGRIASGSGAYSFVTADSTLIVDLHSENYYNTKYLYTASNGITLTAKNFTWGGTLAANTTITGAGFYSRFSGGRLQAGQGAAVTAANDLTLGNDGNTFSITGATQINAITTTNWQAGSVVNLVFASTPLVKQNTAGGAGTATILLAGAADYQTSANDVLSLLYDGTNWHEVSRKITTVAPGSGFWPLRTGTLSGTLTGQDTIFSNIANQLFFSGTYTTSAQGQYFHRYIPAITLRGTVGDTAYGLSLRPNFIRGANTQVTVGLDIKPLINSGAFSTGAQPDIAIRHSGSIISWNNQTDNLGTVSFAYANYWGINSHTNLIDAATGTTIKIGGVASNGESVMLVNMSKKNLKVAATPTTADSLYMVNVIGEVKAEGSMLIAQLPTPVISSVTPQGTTGATTYTYKIVLRDIAGNVSGASAAVSTTTGNATLGATNFNRIVITTGEAGSQGAYFVDLYRTVGGASQGKILTVAAYGTLTMDDNNLTTSGDGTTAPTDNTSGNIGVGILRPIGGVDIKGSVRGDGGATMFLRSGVDSQTTKIAGQINYDGTDIKLADATYNYTIARTLAGSATLDFTNTNAQNSSELTITVRGAAVGDAVSVGTPAAPDANSCFTAYVSAADTVTVRFNNYSSGAIDPASGTYKVRVIK